MIAEKKITRFPRWLLPVLILGTALLIAFMLISSKSKPEPVVVPEKAWLVAVETVQPARYSPSLKLYGKVESLWSSSLTAAVSADVQSVGVIEGDNVSKGDLLMRLDDQDLRLLLLQREADLKEAEASITSEYRKHQNNLEALPREKKLLELTRNEVSRLLSLVKKKVSAKTALDNARQASERQAITLASRQQAVDDHLTRLALVEARLDRATALRDQTLLELARCNVTAPFNGRISRLLIAPGKRARAGDPLIELYDTDAMVVRAQLPSRYLARVRTALENHVPLTAQGLIDGQTIDTQLLSLAGEVSSSNGGVDGLFEIQGKAVGVQQGRFVRLDFKLPAQDNLIALAHEAVYGTDRVYLVDKDSRMQAVKVNRVGEIRLDEGKSLVLLKSSALPAGSQVVSTQLPNAVNGLLIRIADDQRL